MQPRLQPSTGRFLPRVAGGVLVLLLLVVSATARAAEGGHLHARSLQDLYPHAGQTDREGVLSGNGEATLPGVFL